MPVYEFYCESCNTIFNFYSKSINISKEPICPKCRKMKLRRFLSSFSILREGPERNSDDSLPFDEERMERAVGMLAQEAQNINEDDPQLKEDAKNCLKLQPLQYNKLLLVWLICQNHNYIVWVWLTYE